MAKAVPADPRSTKVQRSSPRPGVIRGFEDIFGELRKVIWPTPAELRTMTLVVIATVVVVSVVLGIIDYLLTSSLVKFEFPGG